MDEVELIHETNVDVVLVFRFADAIDLTHGQEEEVDLFVVAKDKVDLVLVDVDKVKLVVSTSSPRAMPANKVLCRKL